MNGKKKIKNQNQNNNNNNMNGIIYELCMFSLPEIGKITKTMKTVFSQIVRVTIQIVKQAIFFSIQD